VIIKVLFVVLIGVAVAVSVRVWWHLKSRRAMAMELAEAVHDSKQEDLP